MRDNAKPKKWDYEKYKWPSDETLDKKGKRSWIERDGKGNFKKHTRKQLIIKSRLALEKLMKMEEAPEDPNEIPKNFEEDDDLDLVMYNSKDIAEALDNHTEDNSYDFSDSEDEAIVKNAMKKAAPKVKAANKTKPEPKSRSRTKAPKVEEECEPSAEEAPAPQPKKRGRPKAVKTKNPESDSDEDIREQLRASKIVSEPESESELSASESEEDNEDESESSLEEPPPKKRKAVKPAFMEGNHEAEPSDEPAWASWEEIELWEVERLPNPLSGEDRRPNDPRLPEEQKLRDSTIAPTRTRRKRDVALPK